MFSKNKGQLRLSAYHYILFQSTIEIEDTGRQRKSQIQTTSLKKEVEALNKAIEETNTSLGRNTLKFQSDIIKTRSGNRQNINFHLLKDGLHPKQLLAKKRLRRLQLDIVNSANTNNKR